MPEGCIIFNGILFQTITHYYSLYLRQKKGHHMHNTISEPIALGLGANLSDPPNMIRQAIELLGRGGVHSIRVSSLYDTEPVDCIPGTARFSNAALTGCWSGTPRELLKLCHEVERQLGRPFPHCSSTARMIDVDILLFGTQVLKTADVTVPHPRLRERLFVLTPLMEIASTWFIPPDNQTVAAAWELCTKQANNAQQEVRRIGSLKPCCPNENSKEESS